MSFSFYYGFLYKGSAWTQMVPFLIALATFFLWYRSVYLSHSARMRTRILIKLQTKILKWIAVVLAVISVLPVIAQGMFSNEFIRLSIICTTLALSYHAYLHWLVRILVSPTY
jgi:hypothetical protein